MSRTGGYVVSGILLLGSVALAALLVAQRPDPERREPPSRIPFAATAPAAGGSGPIPVGGAGTVRPRVEVEASAGVSGRVAWVDPAFASGGRVREGQILFRIEDADFRHRVEQARASVAVERVELLRVEEEARIARAQYAAYRSRRASDSEIPEPGPLAEWEPQIEAAQAALERARSVLAEAELLLSRTAVPAPFDAAVRSAAVGVGQFVRAGEGVGRLYASDAVEIAVALSDAEAALIPGLWELRAGATDPRIAARVIAGHGAGAHVWVGTVDRFEAALDRDTRTLEVIVRVPNPFGGGTPLNGEAAGRAPPLLVGQFAEVEISGTAPEQHFRVPRLALRPGSRGPGNEVWAVRGDALTIVPVEVLQRFADAVYVVGDLTDGEALIVGGIGFATEGMRVRTTALRDP